MKKNKANAGFLSLGARLMIHTKQVRMLFMSYLKKLKKKGTIQSNYKTEQVD